MQELPTAIKTLCSIESASPAGESFTCNMVEGLEMHMHTSFQNHKKKLRVSSSCVAAAGRTSSEVRGGVMPASVAVQLHRQRASGVG